MIKYIYLMAFVLTGFSLCAQSTTTSKGFSDGLGAANYSFNIGSEVGTTFKDSYYFSNYFSPSASWDVTKKFSVVVGVGARYTQLNNMHLYTNEFKTQPLNLNVTSVYTYASGIYKLNPKVSVNATILYENAMFNAPQTQNTTSTQMHDMIFGVNYNVSKHITINAQMHMSDRPYNALGFGSSQFGVNSPFMNSPIY